MPAFPRAAAAALALTALFPLSCSKPERVEIKESRPRRADDDKLKLNASSGDRFEKPPVFQFDTPPGWNRIPGNQFALLKFTAPGEIECSVATAGGEELQNYNRWRKQMGLAEATQAEYDALPRKTVFRIASAAVDLKGSFAPMGATEPKPGYRMLAIIVPLKDTLVTVKMTGPEAAVEAQSAAFDAFASALKMED